MTTTTQQNAQQDAQCPTVAKPEPRMTDDERRELERLLLLREQEGVDREIARLTVAVEFVEPFERGVSVILYGAEGGEPLDDVEIGPFPGLDVCEREFAWDHWENAPDTVLPFDEAMSQTDSSLRLDKPRIQGSPALVRVGDDLYNAFIVAARPTKTGLYLRKKPAKVV